MDRDDEPRQPRTAHTLGDSLDRLSVRDLEELKAALEAELARIDREIGAKDRSREAAASVFKF
ncbi:DUF1192 domain-containing protein [Acuticoccus sp. I52.16.1]|uniref:DUF1192 domain-containing protein n=1 Tax=Acuticoccus sp. I52.16.1 TaxID=2928472 RepID=UPI001FD3E252|nr:DUF1192 domain-containing protein [Acuticoccus sp. I52.16.1]UOM36094.1 DUF1192 domain-containing protein [Acuticoccus sp. I52.16.1]